MPETSARRSQRITPLNDKIVVRQDKITHTEGGLVIPADSEYGRDYGGSRGVVVAVGSSVSSVREDQTVVFAPGAGLRVTHDGVDYLILVEDHVFAIIE